MNTPPDFHAETLTGTIPAFTEWLDSFINFEKKPHNKSFSLDTIRKYAALCSNPHYACKSVHIAGSKGKGSTAAMISAVLTEAGQRVGRYVSPHVNDFRERITQNGAFFSDAAYNQAYTVVRNCVEPAVQAGEEPPSWFELVTLTAFVLFKQEMLDWAVFETGLGGRLDATNIIQPKACLLTRIEKEHCGYLGNTLAEIAAEKAGIIKAGVPVLCAEQQDEVLAVFRRKAEELSAPFFYVPEAVEATHTRLTPSGLNTELHFRNTHPVGRLFSRPIQTCLPLFTAVQAENAALAACAAALLVPCITETVIETALAHAVLPARFQILNRQPLTVIDGAHTPASIRSCVETFSALSDKKPVLVFACAGDKNPADFAPLFAGKVSRVYLTVPGSFKKGNLPATRAAFSRIFDGKSAESVPLEADEDFTAILRTAFQQSRDEKQPLLITGSFYLAAEAQSVYRRQQDVQYKKDES